MFATQREWVITQFGKAIQKACQRNTEDQKAGIDKQDALITGPLSRLVDQFADYKNQQKTAEDKRRTRELATIIGLFLTAAFALGQGIVFYRQLLEMEKVYSPIAGQAIAAKEAAQAANKSAEIAERALIAGQRAFVSVVLETSATLSIDTEKPIG